jgi:hypothetical protein
MEKLNKNTNNKLNTNELRDDDSDDGVETTDIMDIFKDNKGDFLRDNFLASKKKEANNGRSELADKIRMKGKAVEMINLILSNNKDLMKNEDIYMIDELKNLFNQSKNDKSLFESISKK